MESLPDGFHARPQLFRHGAIDDRPPEFTGGIGFPKPTASDDGDVHRAEVLEADRPGFDAEGLGILMTGEHNLRCEAGAIEQHMTANCRRDNARHGAQSVVHAPHECGPFRVVVAEHAEVKTDDGDTIGIETEIDLLCLAQAAHEQGREDQGDRGEHRLRNQQGQTEISTAHTLHARFAALEPVDHVRA